MSNNDRQSDACRDESHIAVEIADEQTTMSLDHDRLRHVARSILADGGFRTGELSVAIVDDETIHRVNRQFLDHDYATDVLSFLLDSDEEHVEGEVVISADTALREATQLEWDIQHEVLLYLIHGVLHLVGYDDHDDDDRREMRDLEKRYLIEAGIAESQIDSRLPDAEVGEEAP